MPNPEQTRILEALAQTIVPMTLEDAYYRLLIYGEGGVGKTKIATDPGVKILYVESDPYGWVTLLNHPENMAKCTRMKYVGLSQLEGLCLAWELGDEKYTSHDLIVIDTLSAIATLDLDVVVKSRDKKNSDSEFGAPTQPDYGVNTERVRKVLFRLLALPVNIILTSHVREDKDQKTGVMYTRPGFTPKLRLDVERLMTLVGYLTAVGVTGEGDAAEYERRLQVHPTVNIVAKSRIGGLPVVITNPNLPQIITKWMGEGKPLVNETKILPVSEGLKPEPEVVSDNDLSTTLATGLEI